MALLPGSIDVKVWLSKSDEEEDPEPVCEAVGERKRLIGYRLKII